MGIITPGIGRNIGSFGLGHSLIIEIPEPERIKEATLLIDRTCDGGTAQVCARVA